MNAALISFLLTIGICTWIYTKLQRYTGNNTKNSLTAVVVSGLIIFLIGYFVFSNL